MNAIQPFAEKAPYATGVEDGIAWAVVAGPIAGLNGYARIPDEGHRWSEKVPRVPNMECGYFESEAAALLNVHGGITYDGHPWLGFDTVHSGDVWAEEWDKHGMCCPHNDRYDRHWTPDLVIAETKSLARQIAAIR